MAGTKAEALDAWAVSRGQAYTRFDYYGHGLSSGEFRKGTISRWRDDALEVLDRLTEGPQVLVGSSMGAWIALLIGRMRPERLHSLVLIAPAPDFTEDLMWAEMSFEIRNQIMEQGEWQRPSADGEAPYPITRALIEDGRTNLVLRAPIPIECPVRILQGMKDMDVPWQHAMRIIDLLPGDVSITLVKNGDHRLSSRADLKRITDTLDSLLTPSPH
jgi:pimeloyl-ACP methyl ester carboxylesterase